MKTMKPLIMWAIVDRKTGQLAYTSAPYMAGRPMLHEREEWARAEVGRAGRVVQVEIREVRK